MNQFPAIFFFFLAGIVIFSSCSKTTSEKSSGKLNGLHKFYYPDGKLYLEINYRDSLPDGMFRQYFKSGILFEETTYRMGIKHGQSKKFHGNGRLFTDTPYDSGRIHGIQKKYRSDGTIAFEAPYYYNNPCVGLKEFYLSGRMVDKYPTIVVKAENKLLKEGEYILQLTLSDNTKRVEFYKGKLTDGKYIGEDVKVIHTRDGVGSLHYSLPPGVFVMEKLDILAKVKTDLNNFFITQVSFNLATENR
jgi:hypothetical protein